VALADTSTAIGAVSQLLCERLSAAHGDVSVVNVGRPEQSATAGGGSRMNIFLYQVDIDGHLREHDIGSGQPPPIWLVLHYLLTAFDANNESDSAQAHGLLGEGILALREMNYLNPSVAALLDNPEPLKITFDPAEADLLSKLMQSNSDSYRLSMAFQVRPIMIASSEPPSLAPLVQTVGPPGNEGVVVIPSLGPCLNRIEPEKFEAGDIITVSGTGLSNAFQEICFNDQCYPVRGAPAGRLLVQVPSDTTLSAGAYAITAVRETVAGRRMSSNAVLGRLLPTLEVVTHGVLSLDPTPGSSGLTGDLILTGNRLGGPDDAIYVAFYQDGEVVLMLEATGITEQNLITVPVSADDALMPGVYQIILRVNGEQAINSPEIDWL